MASAEELGSTELEPLLTACGFDSFYPVTVGVPSEVGSILKQSLSVVLTDYRLKCTFLSDFKLELTVISRADCIKPLEATVQCFIFDCRQVKVDRIGVVHCSKIHHPSRGEWEKR
jgi:hypothetical protein